ncbi:MAG: Fic family protein [Thiobacillaceae bacterium]
MILTCLAELDADVRAGVLTRLRTEWTHHSTALEGNTLSLGETALVLSEGLTIGGKSLKDHQEVIGHARALDWVWAWSEAPHALTETDLFDMHRRVQTEQVFDTLAPVGAWKREPNDSYVVLDSKSAYNDAYALPSDVPALMETWMIDLNVHIEQAQNDVALAIQAYCEIHAGFVRIHPFADGNGRLARLLANLPLLAAGLPPIMIQHQQRMEYIRTLAAWQMASGRPHSAQPLITQRSKLVPFCQLVSAAWQTTLDILSDAKNIQSQRNADRLK